jgi:hypothetical protein
MGDDATVEHSSESPSGPNGNSTVVAASASADASQPLQTNAGSKKSYRRAEQYHLKLAHPWLVQLYTAWG